MMASATLTTLLLASTPTPTSAASSPPSPTSSSSLCTVDAVDGKKGRLSFFRGLLGSSPESPCGIEEVLESGQRQGGEAFRQRRSDEQRKRKESEGPNSSSSSFDERAALEEERERATRDFVESMWQGME